MKIKYKLYLQLNPTKTKPNTNKRVLRFGLSVGWWPCLKAPFIQVGIGTNVIDIWFGLPSYRHKH